MARVLIMVVVMFMLSMLSCSGLGLGSGSEGHSGGSSVLDTLRSVVSSLSEDAHGYLVSVFGKKVVDTLLKNLRNGIKWTSEAVAEALKVVVAYSAQVLGACGIDAIQMVNRITPEGVIFVTQWALLAVVGYWILSMAVCLVAGFLRRTLWLLKVIFAFAMFGLILSDTGASAETTALRLAGLVLACVLLGVGPSSFRGDSTSHMEAKVKVLDKRLREMERSRKDD